MNCPTCKRTDEFVFEKVSRLWRCDRCHERFRIIPTNDGSDRAEEFERAFPTNADRIRSMSDEELAMRDGTHEVFREDEADAAPRGDKDDDN